MIGGKVKRLNLQTADGKVALARQGRTAGGYLGGILVHSLRQIANLVLRVVLVGRVVVIEVGTVFGLDD